MTLKAIPAEERPRERLLRDGIDSLSLAELIAIVLSSGTRGKSVLSLSEELIVRFGSLEYLLDASVIELMELKGIGLAKAIQLKAVFGIALKCRRPQSLKGEIGHYSQEILLVILRDVRGFLIHREQVAVGTLSQVLIHPREVFYPAVRYKAHSMILAHNHPSGDPTPSKADIELTKVLMQSGQVMGIEIDDHLIIGRDRFVSLKEQGIMNNFSKY